MTWTQTSKCPKCGAPIYTETIVFSIAPPASIFTCNCRGDDGIRTTDSTNGEKYD